MIILILNFVVYKPFVLCFVNVGLMRVLLDLVWLVFILLY